MADAWYELVDASIALTQGDLISDCPVLAWKASTLDVRGGSESEVLQSGIDAISTDVVVMTQACDLEHKRVENVILCPHISLTEHYSVWKSQMEGVGQNPTEKAWKAHCNDICNGFVWNFTMLNGCRIGESSIDTRIAYFHEVFTIPRSFLESLLVQRNRARFRLLPPYREHLSQAFARFFMRVGLPIPIEKSW
jgi:hypothetical protein